MNQPTETGSDGARGGELAAAVAALASALRADRAETEAAARRSRRRAGWWRFATLALLVTIVGLAWSAGDGGSGGGRDHVARVAVSGMILDDPARDALFAQLAADDAVKAVLLRIDSPGGTTVGGEALYASIRAVAERKPVVAVMGEVAASAAYIAALATDRIVARGNTLTASIGVIFTAPNFSGALERLGVGVVELKSGPRKAQPSPWTPIDLATLDVERALIDDSFAWFLELVRERRALSPAALAEVRDGRVVTGRIALRLGLVDEIGGESAARVWLERERGVSAGLDARDREPETPADSLLGRAIDRLFGDEASGVATRLGRVLHGPTLASTLD